MVNESDQHSDTVDWCHRGIGGFLTVTDYFQTGTELKHELCGPRLPLYDSSGCSSRHLNQGMIAGA